MERQVTRPSGGQPREDFTGARSPAKDYADTTIRVRYAETDQMGVVYYGNYFTWFEIGRVELCRALGFEYRQMEAEDDSFLVVAEANCRYKRPARFDDLLTIRTRVTAAQKRTVSFGYEIIHQGTDETIATGETTHVICNSAGQTKSLPEKYRKFLPDSLAGENLSAKAHTPSGESQS
jgi:acyl-CoA thioester hydrolase